MRVTLHTRQRRQVIAAVVTVAVILVLAFTFRVAVVRGDSMLPAFRDGQTVLVNRLTGLNGPLRKGDVVLVNTARDVLIKRIAYLPGDVVTGRDIFAFRKVWDYFEVQRKPGMPPDGLKVPPGFIVVLGDNRAVSEDSRTFGPVAFSDVLGRVINAPLR